MRKMFLFLAAALMLSAAEAVEILHPVKVTGSSYVKAERKGVSHAPELTGDGKTGNFWSYWASDFKSKAKPPHWVIFDFGRPVTFDAVKLDMIERYNFSALCNTFTIDYFDGKEWKNLVKVKGYIQKFFTSMKSDDPKVRYGVSLPNAHPVFRFAPVTGTKVRFSTWDSIARLDEMTVMRGWEAPAPVKALPSKALDDGVFRFVFARDNAALEPGFLPVPLTVPKGKIFFADRYEPDMIRRYLAAGTADTRLRIPVKQPGVWQIFLMGGDQFADFPGTDLTVNGKEYRLPGAPGLNFPWIICTVEAKKEIDIQFKAPWLLNVVVAAPLSAEKAFDATVRKVIIGKNFKQFKADPQPTYTATVKPTPAQEKQGFIPFVTPIDQRVFVNTTPKPGQTVEVIRAQGAPETFKAVSTAFRFVKDIPDFEVSWTGPVKATLHPVRNWLQRTGSKGRSKTFDAVPELLEENASFYALKGRTRQYYLIFEVPKGGRPGTYKGKLTITGRGIPVSVIPVEFEVLPFDLPRCDSRQYAAMYEADHQRPFLNDRSDPDLDRARLLDMRRHNMNSILFPCGKFPGKEAFRKQYLAVNKMLDECGFPRFPMMWGNLGMTVEEVKFIQRLVKETKLREIVYYPVDEPRFGKLHLAQKLYPMVKTVPGTRTYSTITQGDVDLFGKYLDFRCYMLMGIAKFEPDRIVRECARDKAHFFWYTNGAREYPDTNRFKAGYFAWRCGSTGQLYWAYDNAGGDAWNDCDGNAHDHNAVYIMDGKVVSTLQWEGIREGLDDLRYLYKLEECIAAAPGSPAAAEGKALLAELRKATVVDLNEYKKRFGKETDIHQHSFWAPEQFEAYRDRVIAAILKFRR